MTVAIIINPISGTGGDVSEAARRAALARDMLQSRGVDGAVHVTEHPGHAGELAEAALARGAGVVIAWGGDGTMNEVGSVLASRDAVLGLVPSGSGNGLARELRIPFSPADALAVALGAHERRIDCGDVDGHLFFNVAGMGLDARVAHQFATRGLARRGLRGYAQVTLRELFRSRPEDHTVSADGVVIRRRTLMLAIANSRQYGNGAIIAPKARLDDGRLDMVVVSARPALIAMLQAPMLFVGGAALVPGVTMLRAAEIEIASPEPVLYHVDGEPKVGGRSVSVRVHAGALRVRVPLGST